jgi:hypothetical protein
MNKLKRLLFAAALSPQGMVAWSVFISITFATVHLAGWRDYATLLTGTIPIGSSVHEAAIRAAAYLICYFGFVLAVPTLLLAAVILHVALKYISPVAHTNELD